MSVANPNFSVYVPITKSNSVNIGGPKPLTDAIYVGGTGDIVVVGANDVAVTFSGAVAGSIVPVQAKRVNSTSTTATLLVALYQV